MPIPIYVLVPSAEGIPPPPTLVSAKDMVGSVIPYSDEGIFLRNKYLIIEYAPFNIVRKLIIIAGKVYLVIGTVCALLFATGILDISCICCRGGHFGDTYVNVMVRFVLGGVVCNSCPLNRAR